MLDQAELDKYFSKEQQNDIITLDQTCAATIPAKPRRPRVRKAKPGHIPRPANSFMTYRAEKQSLIRQFCPFANHRDISKIVATWWHHLSPNEKGLYVTKAANAKIEHTKKYPNYVFKPKSKKKRSQVAAKEKVQPKESPIVPDVKVKEEVLDLDTKYVLSYPAMNDGQLDCIGDPLVPSCSMYGDYGHHDVGGCEDYTGFNLAKFNDAHAMISDTDGGYYFGSFTPTTQVMETPLLDYSESPSMPEESYRSYPEYYSYPGTMSSFNSRFVPSLGNTGLLYYPYDSLNLDHYSRY